MPRPRRSRSFLSAANDFMERRYGTNPPGFPRGIWVAGIVGGLVGIGLFGPEAGFILGLPCLVFYNALHGLLTGRITWAAGDWHPRDSSTRQDDPTGYWSAVIAYFLLGIFLLWVMFWEL